MTNKVETDCYNRAAFRKPNLNILFSIPVAADRLKLANFHFNLLKMHSLKGLAIR
jgi:hypothetical protein